MNEVLLLKRELVKKGSIIGCTVEWVNKAGWVRIGAEIIGNIVAINRIYGRIGEGSVKIHLEELSVLNSLCDYWRKIRNSWPAFFFLVGGYPFGGGRWTYQAPGKSSEFLRLGEETMLGSKGEKFRSKDTEVILEKQVRHPSGAVLVAEIWRCGEKYGSPNGEKVGEVFELNERVKIELLRHSLTIRIGNNWTTLEPESEEKFITELVMLMTGKRK